MAGYSTEGKLSHHRVNSRTFTERAKCDVFIYHITPRHLNHFHVICSNMTTLSIKTVMIMIILLQNNVGLNCKILPTTNIL